MKFNCKEDIIQITPLWKGERMEDGRPKVSSDVLRRLRKITLEEAWGPLWQKGYKYQFEGEFRTTHPGATLVGRAVTGVYVPMRPDLNDYLLTYGGHIGYSVRPAERKNGYATQMLRLTLEKAREHGIEKVRICCDHYNVASAKTIRANGGVLEDECFDSSDGMLTQRYWIQND